jgi:hypothetical protein
MRQSGRVIALSRPTCLIRKPLRRVVPRTQVCPPEETSFAHPFSKEELGILGRESATLVMRNRASCLAFAAATLLKAMESASRAHILCTMRSGPARLRHRVRFTTAPALVSGRSQNLSRFAIPSGSGGA